MIVDDDGTSCCSFCCCCCCCCIIIIHYRYSCSFTIKLLLLMFFSAVLLFLLMFLFLFLDCYYWFRIIVMICDYNLFLRRRPSYGQQLNLSHCGTPLPPLTVFSNKIMIVLITLIKIHCIPWSYYNYCSICYSCWSWSWSATLVWIKTNTEIHGKES